MGGAGRRRGAALQFRDGFGNIVHLITLNARHEELEIEAAGTVETQDSNGVVAGLANGAPPRVFLRETAQTRPDGAIRALAASVHGKDTLATLHELLGAVRDRVEYVPGATDTHTGAAEALADGKGVCQDHAHIFIAAARTLAIPARYVTGYLMLDGQSTASAHHAWAEAWVEGLGWVGFDVANRVCPTTTMCDSPPGSMRATRLRLSARAAAARRRRSRYPWRCNSSSRPRNSDVGVGSDPLAQTIASMI